MTKKLKKANKREKQKVGQMTIGRTKTSSKQ